MTTTRYLRLVHFMSPRDQRTPQIVCRHREDVVNHFSCRCDDAAHRMCPSMMVATFLAAFEAHPCVRATEALDLVLNVPVTFPLCVTNCRYGVLKLWKYVEGLLKELVQMAENLPWVN